MSEQKIEQNDQEAVPETALIEQLPDAGSPQPDPQDGPLTCPDSGIPLLEGGGRRGANHHETVIYHHVETYYSTTQSGIANPAHPACGYFGVKSTNLMANGPAAYGSSNRRLRNTSRPSHSADSCPGCGLVFSIATPTCNERIFAVFNSDFGRVRAERVADRLNAYQSRHGYVPEGLDLWLLFEGQTLVQGNPFAPVGENGPLELERAISWGLV
jgi:hypothetical protein